MLIRGTDLLDTPVMSLQTGTELARSKSFVIDPADLSILAFDLEGNNLTEKPSLLRINDIRELSSIGYIIDSTDEFISKDFVIKIGKIYDTEFNPLNMKVVDTEQRNVGRIVDIVVNTDTFLIEQLVVKQPILRRLNRTEIVIGRSQVVEINSDYFIVEAPTIKSDEAFKARVSTKLFSNPFKETKSPKPATSSKESN